MTRGRPASRLRVAWLGLLAAVGALIAVSVVMPARAPEDNGVTVKLPSEPDAYALAPGDPSDATLPRTAAQKAAEAAPALPVVQRGRAPGEEAEHSEGEVVITLSGDPQDAPRPPRTGAIPPAAYDAALTRQTSAGPAPGRAPGGKTPFTAYRRLQAPGSGPSVAVVLSGLGLDRALTDRAIALPPEISLSFAPYAKNLPALTEAARAAGHEVLIELPMGTPWPEAASLGPAGLVVGRTREANQKRLDWLLARAPAYAMVTNHLGAGFARDPGAIGPVMGVLSEAGLGYVDDTGGARAAAKAAGVPYAGAASLITPEGGPAAPRLAAAARRAEAGEVALIKVYASADAVAALQGWTTTLPQGTSLVPASSAMTVR